MPWFSMIGLPNCTRCLAYFTAKSSAPCAMPSACAAMPGRVRSSVVERDLEAVALLAKQVLDAESRSPRSTSSPVCEPRMPILFSILPHLEAGPVALDDEGADAACAACRVGDGEDGVDVRDAGVGDEVLHAVEDVVVAAPLGARAHRAGVGAGAGSVERVRGQPLAAGQLRDEALLLLFCSREQDWQRAKLLHAEDAARWSRRRAPTPRSP